MPATLADAIIGSLTVKQMTTGQYGLNAQPNELLTSGGDVGEYLAGPARPRWTGTSRDIGGVLGGLSASLLLSVSSGTVTLPCRARASHSTFGGSSAHPQVNGTDGLLVPRRISATNREDATIDLEFFFEGNPTTSVGNSINADATNARWRFAAASVNTQAIAGVVQAEVDFGFDVLDESYTTDFAEDHYVRNNPKPKITLTFENDTALGVFTSTYTVMTALTFFLRKRSGVSYVSDVTEEHISVTMADGIVLRDSVRASQAQNGAYSLVCMGEAITVDPTAAIS